MHLELSRWKRFASTPLIHENNPIDTGIKEASVSRTGATARPSMSAIKTKKHFSRMRTAHLATVRASVATRCQYWWGVEVLK